MPRLGDLFSFRNARRMKAGCDNGLAEAKTQVALGRTDGVDGWGKAGPG